MEKVNLKIDYTRPDFISGFELGVTHTSRGLDYYGDPVAVARGNRLLTDACRLMNVHIHGWGAFFPETAPDRWDWTSLDRRMNYIRSVGGTPVITLCAAPDWMKGPYDPAEEQLYLDHGQLWWWFEKAPLPEFFDEYARVCVEVAKRYPDVKYYQVWNEMKGFVYEDRDHQFDNHTDLYYEEYTDFYNRIYTAMKAHDPSLQIGGFYAVIQGAGIPREGDYYSQHPLTPSDRAALEYWLTNKAGADFICVDRTMYNWWSPYKETYTPDELVDSTVEFLRVANQVHDRCDLPLWWSEYYFVGEKDSPFAMSCAACQLCYMLQAKGESKALLWNPVDTEGLNYPLLTSPDTPDGCQPTRYYHIWKTFNREFGTGHPIYLAQTDSNDVMCLASDTTAVVINKRDREMAVALNGSDFILAPYEVKFI